MTVEAVLSSLSWNVVHCLDQPPKQAEILPFTDLRLHQTSTALLSAAVPLGIYRHQTAGIENFLNGENVCMTTGTASGKSLAFQVAALEVMAREDDAQILAIYPLKALGREQRDRWQVALERAGISGTVGVIDGQVAFDLRLSILRSSRVVVMTPDIIHAWVLSKLGEKAVRNFLRRLYLVIVDEVHTYTGVFGSNAAFLFRRLQHALALLGATPKYFCASATLADPERHLQRLFGLPFALVGTDLDTSPRHKLRIWLAERPGTNDLLSEVSALLIELAGGESKFLAFVDSRKLTEQISSIAARSHESDDDDSSHLQFDHLKKLDILPYRAGYEEKDRSVIQRRLTTGGLAGVVSTSALELGIDIPFLDCGVLVGVPRSSTSLVQRIGRIGRHCEGDVVIVNTGTLYDEAIFSEPESLLNRPAAESALYLENHRIQYIHALCLARLGGEHDQLAQVAGNGSERFSSPVAWPDGFWELCEKERLGEITSELFAMKAEAGEDPNHTFPLRDVESSFRVELKSGPEVSSLGSLSYSQVMREAYPGAVYYYTTRTFRVYKVTPSSREIQVRKERRYTTSPQSLPTLVFPNLSEDAVSSAKAYSGAILIDCGLQIREAIVGFKERRGPNEFTCTYPMDSAQTGIYFAQSRFARNYFTTGVVIAHNCLNDSGVNCEDLAGLLYEAFLIVIPFERQDISFASDKFRADRAPLKEGNRFLSLYDQTYGSLHLSSRLLEQNTFQQTLDAAIALTQTTSGMNLSSSTLMALDSLRASADELGKDFHIEFSESSALSSERTAVVIRPESKGLDVARDNEEFQVVAVFFSPTMQALAYRGRLASNWRESVVDVIPVQNITGIPGETEWALYDYETGELQDIEIG